VILDQVETADHEAMLRVASTREPLADIRHYDAQLEATRKRLIYVVDASGISLRSIRGCGPVVVALILPTRQLVGPPNAELTGTGHV
jgi:hypothetical protein